MPNTPSDLLAFAHFINKTEGNEEEIKQRTIVNRGYYAIYHLAKDIADKIPLPQPQDNSGGSHQRLFNRLIEAKAGPPLNPFVLRSIGYIAARTKQLRVWADYELNGPQPSNAGEQILAYAEKVVEKSTHLIPNGGPTKKP